MLDCGLSRCVLPAFEIDENTLSVAYSYNGKSLGFISVVENSGWKIFDLIQEGNVTLRVQVFEMKSILAWSSHVPAIPPPTLPWPFP